MDDKTDSTKGAEATLKRFWKTVGIDKRPGMHLETCFLNLC